MVSNILHSGVLRCANCDSRIRNNNLKVAVKKLDEFDTKTSSWVVTPPEVRELGGALFGDRRFGKVFIYHNGAESYYGARGFRGSLKV